MVRVRIKSVKPHVPIIAAARGLRAAGFVPHRRRDGAGTRIIWERPW